MSHSRFRLLQNPITSSLQSLLVRHGNANPSSYIALRYFSLNPNQPKNFTSTYLRESLGFSERNAVKASKFVNFRSPENPDRFVSVMKDYGFTQAQISDIARRIPDILIAETEVKILPKLDFFREIGLSDMNLSKMVSVSPSILKASLDDQVKPGYEFLKDLFGSEEKALSILRRWPHVLILEFRKIATNVTTLRDFKVPNSHIATLVENQPRSLTEGSEKYRKSVKEVSEMGYDPSKVNFVLAVFASSSMSKSTRKSVACMDFLVNQACLSDKLPVLLGYSMKKRVIPRCSVLHSLLSNYSVEEKDVKPRKVLGVSEKKFMRKYIRPFNDYRDTTPNLMKMYFEKKEVSKRKKKTMTGVRNRA